MFLGFFNPFNSPNLMTSEITKPLVQKIYKSFIVLYTSPLYVGRKVTIDKYSGCVANANLWYIKLIDKNRSIYIPTSFIYDKIVEINHNRK